MVLSSEDNTIKKKIEEDLSHENMTKVVKGRSVKSVAKKENVGINKIQKAKKITLIAKTDH